MTWTRLPYATRCRSCRAPIGIATAIRLVTVARHPLCADCAQRVLHEDPPADLGPVHGPALDIVRHVSEPKPLERVGDIGQRVLRDGKRLATGQDDD